MVRVSQRAVVFYFGYFGWGLFFGFSWGIYQLGREYSDVREMGFKFYLFYREGICVFNLVQVFLIQYEDFKVQRITV